MSMLLAFAFTRYNLPRLSSSTMSDGVPPSEITLPNVALVVWAAKGTRLAHIRQTNRNAGNCKSTSSTIFVTLQDNTSFRVNATSPRGPESRSHRISVLPTATPGDDDCLGTNDE